MSTKSIEKSKPEGYGGGLWKLGLWKPLRRLRYTLRELLAEALGTSIITFFGPGVGVLTSYTGVGSGDWMVITISWGLAVMMGVYATSETTGAHLNPAVTLTMAVFNGFPWSKVPVFIVGQFIGGYFGALICLLLNHSIITAFNAESNPTQGNGCVVNPPGDVRLEYGPDTSGAFVTWKNPNLSYGNAFAIEVVLTAWLLVGIFSVTNSRSSDSMPKAMWPFLVGLIVVLIGAAFGAQTGYAINPARDWGPRLAMLSVCYSSRIFTAQDLYPLVPLFAPFVGGLLGGCIFFGMIDTKHIGKEDEEGEEKDTSSLAIIERYCGSEYDVSSET